MSANYKATQMSERIRKKRKLETKERSIKTNNQEVVDVAVFTSSFFSETN